MNSETERQKNSDYKGDAIFKQPVELTIKENKPPPCHDP